jgi:hypothetical protein
MPGRSLRFHASPEGLTSRVESAPSVALSRRRPTLRIEPTFDRRPRGSGRSSGSLDPQRPGQALPHAVPRQTPIAELGSLVIGGDDDRSAESVHDPLTLIGRQRGGGHDIEAHLGAGVGPVGVLAPRSATRPERPRQFVGGDDHRCGDPQVVVQLHAPEPTSRIDLRCDSWTDRNGSARSRSDSDSNR